MYPRFSSGPRLVGGGPTSVLVLPARKGRVTRDVVANFGSCEERFRNCSNDNSAALALRAGRVVGRSAGLTATSSAPADAIVGSGS